MDNYDIMNESINNLKDINNTDTYENAVAIYKEQTPIQQGVILRPLPDYGEVYHIPIQYMLVSTISTYCFNLDQKSQ